MWFLFYVCMVVCDVKFKWVDCMNFKYFREVFFVLVVVILLFYLVLFVVSVYVEGGFSFGGIGLFMMGIREMLL